MQNFYFNLLLSAPILWLSIFIFGSTLFRYKISHYLKPILLSSATITIICYILQLNKLSILVSVVQPIGFILCFRYFFRFPWSHSTVMTLIIYSIEIILEWVIHAMNGVLTDNFFMDTLLNNDHSLNIYITFINLIISSIVNKYRLGFTFIHPVKYGDYNATGTNLVIILLAILGGFIVVTTSLSLFLIPIAQISALGKVALAATMVILMVIYYAQELREGK